MGEVCGAQEVAALKIILYEFKVGGVYGAQEVAAVNIILCVRLQFSAW